MRNDSHSKDDPNGQRGGWAGKLPSPELNERLRPRACELRTQQTPAERRLWRYLRRRQRLGYKFRRQHVIDRFVVDFYCAEAQLVVEPDGEVHDFTGDRDVARQDFLEQLDLRVLRFANDDVMTNLGGVITSIERALRGTEASLHGEESGNLT